MAERPLIECVPNVSEGRRPEVIVALRRSIQGSPGVALLGCEPGFDANRTVFTFAGDPDCVVDAAFRLAETAFEAIDMREHEGIHPRFGALDVCPLVPIFGIGLPVAADLARNLGSRIGALGVPVYLYEDAALEPERRSLARAREGGYEALEQRMASGAWVPDLGPTKFNAKSGACAVGARRFLAAYNVNLREGDLALAKRVAAMVRESGKPGLLKKVRAIGWEAPELGRVQVSMNLTNLNATGLAEAFLTVKRLVEEAGGRVSGSELVGLAPLEAFVRAGRKLEGDALDEEEAVAAAIAGLGLDDLGPFDPEQKVLEYRLHALGFMLDE